MNSLRSIINDLDIIMYHDPCMDGLSSAYVAYNYYKSIGKTIELVPRKINSTGISEDVYKDKNVIMIDIVTNDFEKIKNLSKNLIILDHHKTNQEKLKGLDYAYFDMTKSGVGLAWEYFYPAIEIPKFLACIQDRDIWTWKISESREFCDGFYNLLNLIDEEDYSKRLQKKMDLYDELFNDKTNDKFNYYYQTGILFDKIKMNKIKSLVKYNKPYIVHIPDHPQLTAAIFNCTHDIASDLGNYAVENTEVDFAVMWRYSHDDEKYFYSFRSIDSKADVSNICKLFGGGGHRNAAGCESKLHPKDLFNYEKINE